MRGIVKQTSWLIGAQGLTRVISFFYTIFLARNLGVSDFGLYTAAFAYFSLISSFADFGFNRFLIREVASNSVKSTQLLWNISMLRLVLTSALFAIFSIGLYYFDPDKFRVSLVLLATLAVLPQSIAMTFDGIFVGLRNLKFSALSLFISSITLTLGGYYLISGGYGITGAVVALILGQIALLVSSSISLSKLKVINLSYIKLSGFKEIIKGSFPYGILGILGFLYFRIDSLLLVYLRGNFEAGIYGAAYRFLEAITVIPGAFFAALFPVLVSDKERIKELYSKSFKIMVFVGLLVFLIFFFILPEIINLLLPDYSASILAMRILSCAIPFMFLQTPAVAVLFSNEKHLNKVILFSLIILAFNIVTNLIFIPLYGYVAASVITVASEILSFVIFFLLLKFRYLK